MLCDFDLLDDKDNAETATDYEDGDSCPHDHQSIERGFNICADCGVQLHQIFDNNKTWAPQCRFSRRLKDDRNIYKDVDGMGFSHQAVALANELFKEVTRGEIRRATSRKAIICACIFEAYKRIGEPHIYNKIVKQFNLKQKSALKGFKFMVTNLPKDSHLSPTCISPDVFLKYYLKQLGGTEYTDEVIHLMNELTDIEHLNRVRPQSIAAGVIIYWIEREQKNIPLTALVQVTGMTYSTLVKLRREYSAKLNGPLPTEEVAIPNVTTQDKTRRTRKSLPTQRSKGTDDQVLHASLDAAESPILDV